MITPEEKQAEIKVGKQFTEIMKEKINEKRETVTENMVEKEIKKNEEKESRRSIRFESRVD